MNICWAVKKYLKQQIQLYALERDTPKAELHKIFEIKETEVVITGKFY